MSETAVAETALLAETDEPTGRPIVTLQPGGHRRAEAGHPWIYSNEILTFSQNKPLRQGQRLLRTRSP